jgi:AraC family transcriptional activator of pobA
MRKNSASIPVNNFGDDFNTGISIERLSFKHLPDLGEWEQPERHDRHSFFLLEEGSVTMEIDFQICEIHSPSIVYMHPDQVHRIIAFQDLTVCAWALDNETITPEYLRYLNDFMPSVPVRLDKERFRLLSEAAQLCLKFTGRKKDLLYHSLLKNNANGLVGLTISIYLEHLVPADKLSRRESINITFRQALASNFTRLKRPADYAQLLNFSLPYLNECVKGSTGYPISYHVQQRVILEAKRLLYHSDQSLKEIAAALGYDDYPYFSRLFSKVTGMPPLLFRTKNLG